MTRGEALLGARPEDQRKGSGNRKPPPVETRNYNKLYRECARKKTKMSLEEPSTKEVQEAVKFLKELRKDPEKYNRWLDNVLERALKGWRARKTWKTRTKKTRHS